MANIRENKKTGKVISFRFIVCLERDVRGKQIRKYTTWTAPADLTPAKARKAAERAADAWEEEVKAEYQKQKKLGSAYRLPPDKRRDDFVSFVNDTWFVLQIRGENDKPNTIAFYKNMTRIISEYFKGSVLQEISPVDIQKYLVYLRTEYKSKLGKSLSAKTIRDAQPDIWLKVVRGKRKTKCGSHDFQWPKMAKRFDHFWRVSLKSVH